MRKPAYAKTKTQISCAVTAQLISAFVFATQIVQSPYFLNPKFQASSHLLWLYSPVCVGAGRKPRRPVFSERGLIERKPSSSREQGAVARSVECLLRMQAVPRSTLASGTFFVEISFRLPLIQEEQVLSYLRKIGH